MTVKRIAEQIADWLAAQGVEQVFSVTGGGAMFRFTRRTVSKEDLDDVE